jgi:hypothetical protein
MKVVIGPYRNWIGPYQIADLLCFWVPKVKDPMDIIARKPDWVHEFGTWLSEDKAGNDSWLTRACQWVESKKSRQIYVRIDKYDSWSADHTIALIAVPLLKQLQISKHGAPFVDDVDVPDGLGLRSYETDKVPDKDSGEVDENHFKRWDWVLGEIIWALEQKVTDDAESQYYHKKNPELKSKDFEAQMDNITIDMAGLDAWQKRKTRGYKLFGKYYENLWD